jgi:arginase
MLIINICLARRFCILKVAIIGVPADLGANCRGVNMGPGAIRYANLISKIEGLGIEVKDFGDVQVPVISRGKSDKNYITELKKVCTSLADRIKYSIEDGYLPLIIGGDHSITIGTFSGLISAKKDLGLIWFDAHGDFNTLATSQTGNLHGMSLAVINGDGPEELLSILGNDYKLKGQNIVLVGVRSLDLEERRRLKETNINIYTIGDIDRRGIEEVMEEAIKIASQGKEGIHVSFDIDVLDPLVAPGVGTAIDGGLNYREAHLALEVVAESKKLNSLEMVEVNPILDEKNRTGRLAVNLILSALGQRIL